MIVVVDGLDLLPDDRCPRCAGLLVDATPAGAVVVWNPPPIATWNDHQEWTERLPLRLACAKCGVYLLSLGHRIDLREALGNTEVGAPDRYESASGERSSWFLRMPAELATRVVHRRRLYRFTFTDDVAPDVLAAFERDAAADEDDPSATFIGLAQTSARIVYVALNVEGWSPPRGFPARALQAARGALPPHTIA